MVFLPQEIIAKKRDGEKLSQDEIARFIKGLITGGVSEAQAAAFTMATYFQHMDIEERVALTLAMRDSGKVLNWQDLDGAIIDKHSTGGVGDNVSLMLAPILAACGAYVPMISGRGLGHTGGTLDKFDAIPNYNTNPDNELFAKTVKQVGCAIIGQTPDLAPADKILYAIRDVCATVENISLITASILSKKLAAGLDALILDVKIGSGAFMQTLDEAHALSNSLIKAGNGAGLKTGALITNMNEPLASAAGNALEVINAVRFLKNEKQDERLKEITLRLCANGLVLGKVFASEQQAYEKCEQVLKSGAALEKFNQMLAMLGAPNDFSDNMNRYLPKSKIIKDVFAKKSGIISSINTKAIGMAVVVLGGGRRNPSDRIDYAVGFDNLANIGQKADSSTPIARIHANDETSLLEASQRIIEAYEIGGQIDKTPLIYSKQLEA
ncbi:MAG: thymidine phosphorylase [Devosiaceae bacterium]|nr:thymidine phosphorylase [Devosiaceae bacterium]